MSLKTEEVRKIAHLARLQIDESDLDHYATDLSNILAMFEKMNQFDASDIVPMAHPMDATQRLRPDEVTEHDQREKFQAIAPDVKNGLYRVPKVIE